MSKVFFSCSFREDDQLVTEHFQTIAEAIGLSCINSGVRVPRLPAPLAQWELRLAEQEPAVNRGGSRRSTAFFP